MDTSTIGSLDLLADAGHTVVSPASAGPYISHPCLRGSAGPGRRLAAPRFYAGGGGGMFGLPDFFFGRPLDWPRRMKLHLEGTTLTHLTQRLVPRGRIPMVAFALWLQRCRRGRGRQPGPLALIEPLLGSTEHRRDLRSSSAGRSATGVFPWPGAACAVGGTLVPAHGPGQRRRLGREVRSGHLRQCALRTSSTMTGSAVHLMPSSSSVIPFWAASPPRLCT